MCCACSPRHKARSLAHQAHQLLSCRSGALPMWPANRLSEHATNGAHLVAGTAAHGRRASYSLTCALMLLVHDQPTLQHVCL